MRTQSELKVPEQSDPSWVRDNTLSLSSLFDDLVIFSRGFQCRANDAFGCGSSPVVAVSIIFSGEADLLVLYFLFLNDDSGPSHSRPRGLSWRLLDEAPG